MKYGHMTMDRWNNEGHQGKRRVLCDGVDITDQCVEFDDGRNWAIIHRLIDGRPGGAAAKEIERETISGLIEVLDGKPAPLDRRCIRPHGLCDDPDCEASERCLADLRHH